MQDHETARPRARSLYAIIVGAILAIAGLILTIGGAWLTILGGSPFYLIAGIGLLASGILLIRGRLLGAWIYGATWLLSILWGLIEAGLDGWALIPFAVGPTALLVLVLLTLPQLSGIRWRTAIGASGVAILALVIAGFAISRISGTDARALPGVIASSYADASPMRAGTDWPAYGGTYAAQRYSPLGQITPDNVDRLARAWVYNTGDMPEGDPADSKYGAETTPLKVGDTLYLCSATNILIALDPATGKQRWRYDPQVSDDYIPYTAACRGVAYYAAPGASADSECAARIIEGTLDGRLIAVDARNGKPCSGFGSNGAVDIKRGMGAVEPGMDHLAAHDRAGRDRDRPPGARWPEAQRTFRRNPRIRCSHRRIALGVGFGPSRLERPSARRTGICTWDAQYVDDRERRRSAGPGLPPHGEQRG